MFLILPKCTINFKLPAFQIIENELKSCAAISHRPIRENTIFEGIEKHDACNRIIAQFAKKLVVCRATNQGRRILPGGNLRPATLLLRFKGIINRGPFSQRPSKAACVLLHCTPPRDRAVYVQMARNCVSSLHASTSSLSCN